MLPVGSGLRYLGVGAAIAGGILVPTYVVTFRNATRVAEILYAEDFDRMGWEPAWFGPWRFAMQHQAVGMGVLSAAGLAVVLAGALCLSGVSGSARWLERACWAAAICSFLLVTALIPLHAAGSGWPAGTPADHLRHLLVGNIGAGGLETLLLLGTIVVVRRARACP